MSQDNDTGTESVTENQDSQPSVDDKLADINSKIEAMNKATNDQLNIVANALAQQAASQQPVSQPSVDEPDDFYSMDPKKYRESIRQEIMQDVQKVTADSQTKQLKLQQTLIRLSAEFPEISDASTDAYKKVLEVHNNLAPGLQETPEGYELAVRQATSSLGLLPKNMRRNDDGMVNIKGQSGPKQSKAPSGNVADETVVLAQAMGLDTENKEVMERLKKYSKRNYGRYQ